MNMILVIKMLITLGLIDAIYIWRKRTSGGPSVCPLKQDCRQLYDLPQAHFLGIHWDIWGIIYYVGMFALTFIASAGALLKLGAIVGVLVSAYLVYVQYKMKNYCTWCLLSELTTILMAILISKL